MDIEDLKNMNYVYDKIKGRYYVDNPLKSLELKTWPDVMLAISSVPFLISFGAMFVDSTKAFAVPITILIAGILCFGIGAKLAYYRYRDSNIEGNINAWFAGWRHSFLADFFAFIGFLLIFLGIIKLYGI
ncbi:hypothetical protein CW740_05505 [Kangiella profundi]|uniref:Uncharacterized protein n=1 Tax=Kangiella profundi TaxID=1561924 RepID=A0A2K9AIH6_9GAMM|nr:hypothetical protein [Kangiella profundi]AUD78734.1 hypothetical protein CW740_05505 [Kangiella profundi]GGE89932.1 hypothetical protein GCM10011356_00140 [Kangiella profundi]